MANPCNSRPPNRPVFAPPQKVLGFALHSHTVKGGKGGVDVGEERGSPGAGPGSPSNAVERSSQCIHNAAQVTAIRCSFLEGPYTACHSRLPKGASRYITMQPQSTTSNPHSQTHCEAKPRVALEDRFVPEKELVKSDWSPLVLDSSTSTLPADSAAASGAVTRPLSGEEIYLHHGLYSKTECEKIIGVAEAAGFGFTVYPKDYRGNLRLVTNDPALAECTWLRMRGTAPPRLQHDGETWEAVGLNPHWRLSKYYSGDVFQQHLDTCFTASESLRSFYTVNIYLNDAFSDGRTRFFDDDNRITCSVQPAPGLALIFAQPGFRFYSHDGERVNDGIKYLIRSDVMYRRVDS